MERLLHPALPVMQNTDGDPIELTTLTYELGVPTAEAVERLTPLATLRDDVHIAAMPFEDDRASRWRIWHNELGLQGTGPRPSIHLD